MSTNNACYDVKPANIMLTHLDDGDEQQTLPTDFGIARKVDDALSGSQRGLACRRTPVQTLHQHATEDCARRPYARWATIREPNSGSALTD